MDVSAEYCSQHAQENEAPLYGSAAHKQVWLLLEVNAPWRAKAVADNDLPVATQKWLTAQTEAVDGRVLFIKKSRPQAASTLAFYVAVTDPENTQLYAFTVADYDQLTTLDVAAILADATTNLSDETLLLVCTNGKRDRCCAKFGLPVYNAFAAEDGLNVWQTTHIGGHRYAATAAVFPAGVVYGYMAPQMAPTIATHIRQNKIALDHYRGRFYYPEVVSAADYFVRQALGVVGLDEIVLVSAENPHTNHWHIQFRHQQAIHQIALTQAVTDPIMASCNKPLKPTKQFHFLRHTLLKEHKHEQMDTP